MKGETDLYGAAHILVRCISDTAAAAAAFAAAATSAAAAALYRVDPSLLYAA